MGDFDCKVERKYLSKVWGVIVGLDLRETVMYFAFLIFPLRNLVDIGGFTH